MVEKVHNMVAFLAYRYGRCRAQTAKGKGKVNRISNPTN